MADKFCNVATMDLADGTEGRERHVLWKFAGDYFVIVANRD